MSWRDSEDPRCPECGEKISATATYCMHCYADLPTEEDVDIASSDEGDYQQSNEGSQSEQVDRGNVYGSGSTSTAQQTPSTTEGSADTQSTKSAHPSSPSRAEGSAYGPLPNPHSLDGLAGRVASMLFTDVPDTDRIPDSAVTAPLWMRAPVAFVAGLFTFVALAIMLALLLNDVSLPGEGLLYLAAFVGIMIWLGNKPLPSDIVADACYGTALVLLTYPVVFLVNRLGRTAVGAELSLEFTVVWAVITLFVVMVPAVVFLVIGYFGNRYARSKLDSKAETAGQATG